MSTVPVLRPGKVVKTFEKSIPNHPEVARGTLRSIVARAGLTMDEFLKASKG